MYKRRCPKCDKEIIAYPALSRIDNKTEICETCGTEEAFQDAMGKEKTPIKYKTVQTILVRKPRDAEEIIKDTKELIEKMHTKPETYRIVKTIELGFLAYNYISQNLFQKHPIIAQNKDLCTDSDMVLEIKERGSQKTGILILPEGYDYCRHAGVEIRKLDIEEFMKKVAEENEQIRQEEEEKKLQEMIKKVEAHGYKCVVVREENK